MARVDELMAGLLARERRVEELFTAMLEGDSSDGSIVVTMKMKST